MKKHMLINLSVNDSFTDEKLTSGFLKTAAFASCIRNKKTNKIYYSYIAIPLIDSNSINIDGANKIISHITTPDPSLIEAGSIYDAFKEIAESGSFTIQIMLNSFDSLKIGIAYCDGSSTRDKCGTRKSAAYSMVRLSKPSYSSESLFESFTGTTWEFNTPQAEAIPGGTNNVGELTGIKKSVESMTDSNIQLIVSDSEYSVKCFREWIHNWEENNYRKSQGGTIENMDLIKDIRKRMIDSKKIILLKWVRGHDDDPFNELCDRKAKEVNVL